MTQEEKNHILLRFAGFRENEASQEHPVIQRWRDPEGRNLFEPPPNFYGENGLSLQAKWVLPQLWACNIMLEEVLFWNVKVAHPNYGEGQALVENNLTEACADAIVEMLES